MQVEARSRNLVFFLLGDRKQFVGIIESDLFVEQCLFWWSAGCLIIVPSDANLPCMQRPRNNSCSKAIRRKCWPIMLKNDSWQTSQHKTRLAEESGENDKRHSSKFFLSYKNTMFNLFSNVGHYVHLQKKRAIWQAEKVQSKTFHLVMNYPELITLRPGIYRGIRLIQTDAPPQIFDPNEFQM